MNHNLVGMARRAVRRMKASAPGGSEPDWHSALPFEI
jgi:hypothetical protein